MGQRILLIIFLVPVLVGCGGSGNQPTDSGVGPDSLGEPGFKEDPRPSGPAVWVTVDMSDPAAPVATVWAQQLGPVFGLALQVKLDETQLSAESPKAETWLGPDAPKAARYLTVARTGGVSLGAVRRGSAAGEQEIASAVKLATIPLKVLSDGRSHVAIEALQVRRSDGKFTPVKAAGGDLTVRGAP